MNVKQIIRMNAIMVGLAASLFLASSARAQQEMDPTPFNDGPFVSSMAQPIPATSANQPPAGDVTIRVESLPAYMAAQSTEASIVSNVEASAWTTLAGWALITLAIGVALFIRRKFTMNGLSARKHLTTTHGLPTASASAH